MKQFNRRFTLGIIATACCLTFNGCEYDVPITSKPTRKVEARLLGDWLGKDSSPNGKEKLQMKVRKLDDSTYIVSYDGDLCRAYHSDVAKTPFISVQDLDDLDSVKPYYAYLTWKLSEDGKQLSLRFVRNELVPYKTRDSASVQKLLKQNLQNPKLFDEDKHFTKEK